MNVFKYYVFPVVTLAGSIIGVGFLSLPYIAVQIGLWPMVFYFCALGSIVLIIHLLFSEVSLHTPDYKRWPGFVGYYFGPLAKRVMILLGVLGSLGVLLSYLLIGGHFLATMAGPLFGGNTIIYVLIYFAAASFFVFRDIKIISKIDLFAIAFLLIVLLLIFISAASRINSAQLFSVTWSLGVKNFLVPYGPIMFALWGAGFIPEIEEMIRGKKKIFTTIIISAFVLVAAFYLLFIFLVLGISGLHTSDSALTGLATFLGPGMAALALSIGVATTFIAFIAQGILLKQVFTYDLKIKEVPAWVLTCFTPLILYFLGFHSFIPLISFVGGFLLGLDGILILLMYRRIKKQAVIIYPLMAVFVVGILYTLLYSLK